MASHQETKARLESDMIPLTQEESLTSIAISLKRIADVLDETNDYGEKGFRLLYRGIVDGFTFTGGPPRG